MHSLRHSAGAAVGHYRAGRPAGAGRPGLTLLEFMIAFCVALMLAGLLLAAMDEMRLHAMSAQSATNLRALVGANLLYAADHNGQFCPAQDPANLMRWHGARTSIGAPFDPTKGYLSPYLGDGGWARICPVFLTWPQSAATFEKGSGGYGYNAAYIGGTPESPFVPEFESRVQDPARTIMFTDTAFARADGIQEYPYCEPFFAVNANGSLSGSLAPSVHFRHNGLAHVAWCDGAVTAEPPSQLGGVNIYGGDSAQYLLGWVGPSENNGWWNARRTTGP
jgi:prepilin-type processing-associated H-X9-DG protein